MYEYLILIACFGLLIVVKMFLFKRSYTRKMGFYSDPDEFAEEFLQNLDSQAKRNPVIKKQFMNTDNLLKIMDLNFKKLPPLIQNKDKIERYEIVEVLRKISLPIALINKKHNLSKENLIRDFKLASQIVFPNLEVLTAIRDLAKTGKEKNKEIDYVNWSIEKYYEYILSNLTPYLFPYS